MSCVSPLRDALRCLGTTLTLSLKKRIREAVRRDGLRTVSG